jgi:hypothetical protein
VPVWLAARPERPPSAPAAEFESDLIKMRTRQCMKVAKVKGRLRANSPNSNPRRKRTSSNCGGQANTPAPNSPSCSPWPPPPSTARCSALASRSRHEPLARQQPHFRRRDQAPRASARRWCRCAGRSRFRSADAVDSCCLASVAQRGRRDARPRTGRHVAQSGQPAADRVHSEAGCRETLRYAHRRAASELLLAVPDAIAWCWAKGGHWRRRVERIVTDVREV